MDQGETTQGIRRWPAILTYAKVRYETLAEAQSDRFGLSTYPCNHCLYWHNANFKSKIKRAINCLGCGLPMADRGHKYCCLGCKRRGEKSDGIPAEQRVQQSIQGGEI
jgi:hypothetical protein